MITVGERLQNYIVVGVSKLALCRSVVVLRQSHGVPRGGSEEKPPQTCVVSRGFWDSQYRLGNSVVASVEERHQQWTMATEVDNSRDRSSQRNILSTADDVPLYRGRWVANPANRMGLLGDLVSIRITCVSRSSRLDAPTPSFRFTRTADLYQRVWQSDLEMHKRHSLMRGRELYICHNLVA